MPMLLYHLRSAARTILKFKSHTAYSLVGLVIGLACVFIISSWAIQELRYDRFHKQSDQIYMVTTDIKDHTGNITRFPETPGPLAEALEAQIPQIEHGFHFLYLYGGRSIANEAVSFKEEGIAATAEFLDVFNFRLISGTKEELDVPNSIFLSRRLADKIFPDANPVGQELLYKEDQVLVVKGVFKDVPRNSSLQFDFLIPYQIEYGISEEWWQLSDASFIKVAPAADIENVYLLMKKVWREKLSDDQYNIGIIPITDLRYTTDCEFFNAEHGHGNRKKLFMFMGVAMLILILACLNYMNLVSAYALKREHEVWIRKVHGASTGSIANYLIIESVLLSIFAWGLAAVLSLLGLRVFQLLLGVVISPAYLKVTLAFGLVTSIIIVGIAAGFYPAVRAASDVLVKTRESKRPSFMFQHTLRNVFVLSQFVLSIALTISSIIIIRQANFMMEYDTGYEKADIVEFYLPVKDDHVRQALRNTLGSQPGVEGFCFGGASPVSLTLLNTIEKWRWEGLEEGTHASFYHLAVDEEYLNIFQIPLLDGRFFSTMSTNQGRIVINERLAALLGFENPVGQILRRGEEEFEIIGVVRDFNFQHLSSEIRPLAFTYSKTGRRLFVKINAKAEGAIGQLEEQISAFSDDPVVYDFVIDDYDKLYEGEQQMLSAVLIFTILCILLSSLGLIALVSHGTQAKTKEIALRKVFGAETLGMIVSLNRNIIKLYLPGLVLGSLAAWLIMRRWLDDFVYRRGFEGWVFLFGAAIILVVALLSVSLQTWKAANQSPALTLKSL
jgi:putative ABC transport system permease protein